MIEAFDVAEGDLVRVVLEGAVKSIFTGGFWLRVGEDAAAGNGIMTAEQHVISVEKLAKPLAVGDVLTAEQYAARDWEQHSVLLDLDEVDVLLLAPDEFGNLQWKSSASHNWFTVRELGRYISNVKVLHLPEAAQSAAKAKDAK